MSKELVPFNADQLNQLPSTQLGTDESFNDLAKNSGFLKYLKLCSNDKYAKAGKIASGHWGIPDSDGAIQDLGTSIDVLPLAKRPKAVDMKDKSALIISYDVTAAEFKRIRLEAAEKDSDCQFGVSFLVLERSTGQFLELFFGNETSRRKLQEVYPYLPLSQADIDARAANKQDVTDLEPHFALPLTINIKFIEDKKGRSWHGPVPVKCSAPFAKIPPIEEIVEAITRFKAVKSDGVEKIAEPEGKKKRAH